MSAEEYELLRGSRGRFEVWRQRPARGMAGHVHSLLSGKWAAEASICGHVLGRFDTRDAAADALIASPGCPRCTAVDVEVPA